MVLVQAVAPKQLGPNFHVQTVLESQIHILFSIQEDALRVQAVLR